MSVPPRSGSARLRGEAAPTIEVDERDNVIDAATGFAGEVRRT
jgi:hypothetical protein